MEMEIVIENIDVNRVDLEKAEGKFPEVIGWHYSGVNATNFVYVFECDRETMEIRYIGVDSGDGHELRDGSLPEDHVYRYSSREEFEKRVAEERQVCENFWASETYGYGGVAA